jgi:hypothetical protein
LKVGNPLEINEKIIFKKIFMPQFFCKYEYNDKLEYYNMRKGDNLSVERE